MKRNVVWILLLSAALVWAQDNQRLSERDIAGTARYVGMAGAMTAVGGDPSAVLDNPAGLGVYSQVETTLSFEEQLDYAGQKGSADAPYLRHGFAIPQASLVLALGANNANAAMRYCNFLIGYNRVKNFNRTSCAINTGGATVASLFAEKTNGHGLTAADVDLESGWDNPKVGWMSLLGYGAYAIDPVTDTTWAPAAGMTALQGNELQVTESGYIDEFNVAWGANLRDRWYIGLGLNIRDLTYLKTTSYWEDYTSSKCVYLGSQLSQSGVGISGSIGVIYQPIQMLRLGVSFHTPVAFKLDTHTSGEMYQVTGSNKRLDSTYVASGEYGDAYSLTQPLRVTAGAAIFIAQRAIISLEYDYRHWKHFDEPMGTDDVHTLKVGCELNLNSRWYMNVGYAFESSFLREYHLQILPITSVRTDLDFRNSKWNNYIGASFGYRGPSVIAQLGYQYRNQRYILFPHEYQDCAQMNADTHRIVLTLAWHSK